MCVAFSAECSHRPPRQKDGTIGSSSEVRHQSGGARCALKVPRGWLEANAQLQSDFSLFPRLRSTKIRRRLKAGTLFWTKAEARKKSARRTELGASSRLTEVEHFCTLWQTDGWESWARGRTVLDWVTEFEIRILKIVGIQGSFFKLKIYLYLGKNLIFPVNWYW